MSTENDFNTQDNVTEHVFITSLDFQNLRQGLVAQEKIIIRLLDSLFAQGS